MYYARTLMAEKVRQKFIRPLGAFNFVYLSAANATVV
jgi:hypothetical protein